MLSPICGKTQEQLSLGKAERRISEHTTCKATNDNRFSNDRKHLTVFDTNFNSLFLAPTPIPYKRCFNTLQITLWRAGVAFTAAVFASHPRLRVARLSICKYWWGLNVTNGWEPCATSKRMHGRLPSYTARDCVAGNRGIGALHPDVSTFRTPGGCESSNRLGIICDLDTKRYLKG